MKFRIVLAAAAALALTACGKSETTEAAGTATSEAAAPAAAEASMAPAAETAAPTAGGAAPTKEYMVGKWTEDASDCQHMVIQFNADGSMKGPFDKWELDGGVLTMVGNPQKMHLTVVDADTIESKLDGTGSPHKIHRCK